MSDRSGCAIWITGMPASGKSSIRRELVQMLRDRSVPVVVLESDELREILTPEPSYSPEERDRLYREMAQLGALIIRSGTNVIFDATACKRAYREAARALIPRFIEVFVDTPLEICMQRDPKGIYGRAASGESSTVPGVQAPYEPPLYPELTVDGQAPPDKGAEAIIMALQEFRYL